jgi:hypothetical protein
VLEGGVTVLVKPLCTHQNGGLAEVAAWRLTCLLGWTGLVPVTVLRSMWCPSHDTVEAVAAIIMIESRDDFPEMSAFSDEELWKAAVFDVLAAQTDRGGRSNYLGVLRAQSRLRPFGRFANGRCVVPLH